MRLKKILIVSSLLVVAGAAEAVVAVPGLVSGANTVTTSACALLASDVSITLSTGNIGAYQCSTTTANIGLAVASTSGKNKIFSVSSAGGAITTTESRASPGTSDLDSAASSSTGETVTVQSQTNNTGEGNSTL